MNKEEYIEKMVEKQVFFQAWASFLCVTNDKIIVNDGNDGLLLYDEELNLIRRIAVPSMEDISLYEIYPLGDEVLIDSGEGTLVWVNLETGVDKAFPIPKVNKLEFLSGCTRISENTILLRVYENHDYYLNTDTMEFSLCTNTPADIVLDFGLNHHGIKIPDYLHSHDFLRAVALNGVDFYLYDKKLLILTPDSETVRYPEDKYYNFRIGVMNFSHPQVVVLGGIYSEMNSCLTSYRFEE